ncbi:hypothetical protein C0Q70_10939 [Pomacea canaliculata]|uniref:Uncharacterized protein n=1 Tax=Pomacea canaliculata TaxID=400727 RepID=A0A2T7P4K3_POMCA|nr:hypothetical protein C0Q70_10939 [Pomacea canaliculata]
MKVKITEVGNGAKLLTQQCPLPADDSNYRAECCSYVEGDCYIPSRNAFPTECQNVNNCQPRATWADTSKDCNTNDFPPQTHYMEITYTCVAGDKTTLVTTVTTQTTSPTTTMDNTTTTTITTTHHHHVHRQHCRQQRGCSPAPQHRGTRNGRRSGTSLSNYTCGLLTVTPAMVGGMIAGIAGLLLTIFIFIFYWGRKRQIRISGKAQNTVWDFLLSNSMSVRAFRGYDNFSSARSSVSSEDGSPVIRKTVWLPNISVDSGHGDTITSDDNCSVRHHRAGAAEQAVSPRKGGYMTRGAGSLSRPMSTQSRYVVRC